MPKKELNAIKPYGNVVLCALDSQYVHTNLAVHYIKSYADKHARCFSCQILEGTVNEPQERFLDAISERKPDIVAFSAYIWNIREIRTLCERLRREMPQVPIILGGPEVTFNPEPYLADECVTMCFAVRAKSPLRGFAMR